jgi:hypothetical protein
VTIGTITTLLFVPYLYSVFGRFERKEVNVPAALTYQGSAP